MKRLPKNNHIENMRKWGKREVFQVVTIKLSRAAFYEKMTRALYDLKYNDCLAVAAYHLGDVLGFGRKQKR